MRRLFVTKIRVFVKHEFRVFVEEMQRNLSLYIPLCITYLCA